MVLPYIINISFYFSLAICMFCMKTSDDGPDPVAIEDSSRWCNTCAICN